MEDSQEDTDARPSSKVARLIDEYELGPGFGERLERRWTADADRMSLRDLADLFNRRVLDAAMTRADMSMVDGEVDNFYRLLTGDDVSSGMRTEARSRLDREGVDVDQLERDFVTYQAIRTYLREFRGAEYEQTSDAERVDAVTDTIQRLRTRLRSVTTRSLEQLRDTERIALGGFRLFVDVEVLCEDCGAQYRVDDLLARGGCDCEADGT